MTQKLLKLAQISVNIFCFAAISVIITNILWNLVGKEYVYSEPVGGDYFNALTYLQFFTNYHASLPRVWLDFLNEGQSVIGGYPFLFFYVASSFTRFYDLATSMNIASFGFLLAFFLSCLLLFWQASKNWLIAFSFTLIVIVTKASYYQLTTGGFIAAASAQWYLPAVLYFIYRFGERHKQSNLIAASIITGLALVHHGPTSLLMVYGPSFIVLLFKLRARGNLAKRLYPLATYTLISTSIGLLGLYTVFLQTFLGSGKSLCRDIQCWGDYPTHLVRWLNPYTPITAIGLFIITVALKLFKRKINLLTALPSIAGFLYFAAYAAAAHFKLINGIANVIFPTRTFWAINILILLTAAGLFNSIRKVSPKYSHLIASITALVIVIAVLEKPFTPHKDRPNTIPPDVAAYIIPEFRNSQVTNLIPDWLLEKQSNWRIDIFNANLIQWWNLPSNVPATKGYSSHPLGIHSTWQYFLQTATRSTDTGINQELAKNRALFLLDAYGVKYMENSQIPATSLILDDKSLIKKQAKLRDFDFIELADITTPIVSATNTPAVLFIGNDSSYESFIRAIAMTNINSQLIIPVKGPQNVGSVTKEELKKFQAVILYQYRGENFDNLSNFVTEGGKIFIDTAAQNKIPTKALKKVLPFNSVSQGRETVSTGFQQSLDSILFEKVDVTKFSPLIYKGTPWKYSQPQGSLKPWAKTALTINNKPQIIEGDLGNGKIIWSGFNLPFHIVDNNNYEEAKLFKNIILALANEDKDKKPAYNLERPNPGTIRISALNSKGIYVKENYDSGWQAKIGANKIKIYKAGLDFMYIPIINSSENQTVLINFNGSIVSWIIYCLSLLSLALASVYLVLPQLVKKLLYKTAAFIKPKISRRVKKILDDE